MSARSEATRVRRHPERGRYDRATIDAILDEALHCHVAFVIDGLPAVIPTIHARVDDTLYLHGSPASRMLGALGGGVEVCVTVTIVDGLVLARSQFNHSLNYRSVVVVGRARRVDGDEKSIALAAVVEHVMPGRCSEARSPNEKELATTEVLALDIREASAKVRSGPPTDAAADQDWPAWAGVLPLQTITGEPVAVDDLLPGLAVPDYVRRYHRGPAEQ